MPFTSFHEVILSTWGVQFQHLGSVRIGGAVCLPVGTVILPLVEFAGEVSVHVRLVGTFFGSLGKLRLPGSALIAATLPEPTAYTPALIQAAHRCLRRIYRSGYRYKKAGVMLTGIQPKTVQQVDLFARDDHAEHRAVVDVVDRVNERFGRGTVFFAASGTKQDGAMRRVRRSKRYTTRWEDVPNVLA